MENLWQNAWQDVENLWQNAIQNIIDLIGLIPNSPEIKQLQQVGQQWEGRIGQLQDQVDALNNRLDGIERRLCTLLSCDHASQGSHGPQGENLLPKGD